MQKGKIPKLQNKEGRKNEKREYENEVIKLATL